jgi:hypothetical protein
MALHSSDKLECPYVRFHARSPAILFVRDAARI